MRRYFPTFLVVVSSRSRDAVRNIEPSNDSVAILEIRCLHKDATVFLPYNNLTDLVNCERRHDHYDNLLRGDEGKASFRDNVLLITKLPQNASCDRSSSSHAH